MATPTYNPLDNAGTNLKALLQAQNEAGQHTAELSGWEPDIVLAAKTVFNASGANTSPSVDSLTGLGAGVKEFLKDPTSAKLENAVADSSTGTGALVFNDGPTIENLTIAGDGEITGVMALSSANMPSEYVALNTVARTVITNDKSVFNDGTNGWIAALGVYGDVYMADFYLAASQYHNYFTPSQIYNVYRKFILAKDGSGNLPINILAASAAAGVYYSGLDNVHSHTTGDPIWCIPLLMKQFYDQTGTTTNFTGDLAILKAALQGVPRNATTHLVSAGTTAGTLWISWGFHDGVQKSGDDLVGSIWYYRAARAMAELYTAIGDTANAAIFTADADLIAANIGSLYNAASGMFFAASIQNAQIDINGSAMAAYYGLATAEQARTVSVYLNTNAGTLFNSTGYVRQSPTNWAFAWSGSTYDNNFWSWGNFWVLEAMKITNPSAAASKAALFAGSANTDREYFIGSTPSGATNNLESPFGVLRFIAENPLLFGADQPTPQPLIEFDTLGNTYINGVLYLPAKGLVVGSGNLQADPGAGNAKIFGTAQIVGNLNANANVNIGTGSGSQALHVENSVNGPVIAEVYNTNTGANATGRLLVSNGTHAWTVLQQGVNGAAPGEVSISNSGNTDMVFNRNSVQKIRIGASGVNIGTVAGSQLLHVEDNVNGNVIVEVYNINSGANANCRYILSNGTAFANIAMNGTGGAEPGNLRILTTTNNDVILSRNNVERIRLDTNGAVFSGILTESNTTEATAGGVGAVVVAGGAYIAKAIVNGGIRIVSSDTRSGAGAVSVTKDTTKLTSTGVGEAITLADGVDGQLKTIIHDVDGGSMVLTPTTKTGFSTITFANAGDSVTLQFVTTRGWIVKSSYGVVIAP